MKIGLIGLPQTGKKTLFSLLTGHKFSEKDLTAKKTIQGIAQIKDPRFDFLASVYKPKSEVRARIDIELLPDIESESIKKGDIFKDIAEFDALCHVVRAFEDESVYHVNGSVDFKRDIDNINAEFILHDLLFVEKRIARIELNLKKIKNKEGEAERKLLLRLKSKLEEELPLRLVALTSSEEKVLAIYPFLTAKKLVVVLNVSEDELNHPERIKELKEKYEKKDIEFVEVSVKAEAEIAELETKEEQEEFLEALGIKEPAVDVLTRQCLRALRLISFFTVSSDELRQWLLRENSSAPEAARVIHSDMQKGFIRAEVMKYADFSDLGSEAKLRQVGKVSLKGKDYLVEDGDIINIMFNI